MLRREEEWDRPPLIDNRSSQQLIRTIHPVEEEHVRDKMVEWEREHIDNRLSPSRMSRSSRRKKIFDGSIVQHEEVESEYLQQSKRSQ